MKHSKVVQEEKENSSSWKEIEESLHELMKALCHNSRKYSNDTNASLHTLWNLSKTFLAEHPSYAICIGNRLLKQAGNHADKEIIQIILDSNINPQYSEIESLLEKLEPFGKHLWNDHECSLDEPKIKQFLNRLLE